MICLHCNAENSPFLPFTKPLEHGHAYAQVCATCGHVLGLRPRVDSDPPVIPCDLSDTQIARLEFLRWRLAEREAQIQAA